MPLPQGFVLEQQSQPLVPKLPQGFVLEGQQSSPVLNQNKTQEDIPQLSQGHIPSMWERLMDAGRTPLNERSYIERLTLPPTSVERMQPGIPKAIAENVTLPNIGLGLAAGPVIKGLASAGPVGKAALAYILTKLGVQGAEQAGTLVGQASTEQGKEQQYHYGEAGVAALPALGLAAVPLARPTIPVTGARPTTGLTTRDIADISEGRERIPIQRQLQQPTRFIGGGSTAPVIDISQLTPKEVIEAQRLAQANATLQERQLADIASKKKFGGGTPIIGRPKIDLQSLQALLRGEQQQPSELPTQSQEQPKIIPSTEVQTQPKETQGGQVSFSAEAKAGGVPSARQAAIEDIRPAVRTMDNKVYVGAKGDTHNDIITKNNLAPTMIDRRAFVDSKGTLISREELAKQGVPGEPSSVPGAHATGLAEVQQATKKQANVTPLEYPQGIPKIEGLSFYKLNEDVTSPEGQIYPKGRNITSGELQRFGYEPKVQQEEVGGQEGTRLYGGLPFTDPKFYEPLIKDSRKLADKAVEGVSNFLEKGKLTEAISRKYDSIRGVSQRVADQLSNNIRGPLGREFGKKDQALSEQALSLVRESKEDKTLLQDQYNRRGELSGKPREKEWTKAAEFALSNWDRLVPLSKRYQSYTDQVLSRLSDVDRPVEKRSGYVRHLPESSDNVTGFRRAREYDTFFDRIKAGSDPKSLNSVDLLKSTIYDAHRSYIQSKAFNDWMTKTKTPGGKPLAVGVKDYEKIERGQGRQPDVRPPSGYSEIAVGGQRIAVLDEYKGLLQRLTDASIFDRRSLGRALQQYAGLAKHVQFAIDLVHLGRMARIEMAAKGGTGNLPLPSYKKGILTLDYTPQELEAKVKAGEIDKEDLPELLENRKINNKLVEGGFNVGHYADALRSNWVEKLPVSGPVQRYIFNVFTRGAMAEVGPITYRLYKKQYPNLTEEQLVGKVVHDLNYTFRNLGKQGPIKSATGDDLLRLLIAAPQWTIGTPMYEAQAIGGTVKGLLTGKFNIQSRTVGTMIAAYLIANQVINYGTTGHSTFENEKGHRLDAWVPVGENGYWVGPEAAALETVNRIEQVVNKSETPLEGLKNYIDPKLSTGGKALATAATGHEYGLTGPLLPKKEQGKAALEQLIPKPIIGSASMKEGQLAPQLMKTLGAEGTPALSDRQKMYQLARQWMNKNKIDTDAGQFVESKYLPLTDALRKGDLKRAKELYDDLKTKVDDKLIRAYYKNYTNRGFTNSEKHEQEFLGSLSQEQRVEYERAKQSNDRVKEAFFQMLNEPAPASNEKGKKGKRQKKFKLFGE